MGEEQRKLIEQGQKQLRAIEAEKRMLYDRTIGGASMPRPSVNFIKDNVGKPKSEVQTDREAFAHVYPKMNQKAADAWLVKNGAAKQTSPEKLREAWNGAGQQRAAQKQTTSQEQLREAWNANSDPARAKQRDRQRERGGQER